MKMFNKKEYLKKYRELNKEKRRDYNRAWRLRTVEKRREVAKAYWLAHKSEFRMRALKYAARMTEFVHRRKMKPCSDCGVQYNWWVMDFDHREGETKSFGIGSGTSSNNREKIKLEISKCDVVCANCHRERTQRRQAWKKQKNVSSETIFCDSREDEQEAVGTTRSGNAVTGY